MKIIRNSVKCHKCNEEIESKHRHDFRWCKCQNIAVDGGKEYLRRAGEGISDKSYTDTSKVKDNPND
jgi:tRNA(Ile2) C34 agmatinyltransferase TiaS